MTKIKFAECVICGRKKKWVWGAMDGWDFGVDVNDIKPDSDGGARGIELSCWRASMSKVSATIGVRKIASGLQVESAVLEDSYGDCSFIYEITQVLGKVYRNSGEVIQSVKDLLLPNNVEVSCHIVK